LKLSADGLTKVGQSWGCLGKISPFNFAQKSLLKIVDFRIDF
jgi:hypothetical protein